MSTRDVVDRYFTALKDRDFTTMHSLLHDDVTFQGPLGTTANADEFVSAMKRVTANMISVTRQALFTEGEDACQIYDMVLSSPDATLHIAQWLKVRDDRISAVRLFFDARPFGRP